MRVHSHSPLVSHVLSHACALTVHLCHMFSPMCVHSQNPLVSHVLSHVCALTQPAYVTCSVSHAYSISHISHTLLLEVYISLKDRLERPPEPAATLFNLPPSLAGRKDTGLPMPSIPKDFSPRPPNPLEYSFFKLLQVGCQASGSAHLLWWSKSPSPGLSVWGNTGLY